MAYMTHMDAQTLPTLSTLPHCVALTGSPVAEKRATKSTAGLRKKAAPTTAEHDAEMQAAFLASDVLEHMLNETVEGGVRINGYTKVVPGNLKDVGGEAACIRREDFQRARRSIISGCKHIKLHHGKDIAKLCQRLDIGDEELQDNFIEALDVIWEQPRNWGRLISLFVAAYFICERLHREHAEDKIESVIGWLSKYLKAHAVPWVVAHGGFASVLYGTQVPKTDSKDCKADHTSASFGLVGLALGLGAAVVVGTLVGR